MRAGGLDQGAWAGAGGASQKQQQWDGDRHLQLLTRNVPSMVTERQVGRECEEGGGGRIISRSLSERERPQQITEALPALGVGCLKGGRTEEVALWTSRS